MSASIRFVHFAATLVRRSSPMWADEQNIARWDEETRVTVCFSQDGEVVKFGAAFCAPQDGFNRKIGRNIAEGRHDVHYTELDVPAKITETEIMSLIATHIQDTVTNGQPEDDEAPGYIPGLPNSWQEVILTTVGYAKETGTVREV